MRSSNLRLAESLKMTDAAAEKLKSLGWSSVDASGLIALVGPLWHRVVNGSTNTL